ncbi:MAG: disulfide bond formation protein B [Inquilinaceae bacterium]
MLTLHRNASPILLLACTAVLGTALASQYWGGLRPCELCLYQRWPYAAAIGLALLAVAVARARRLLLASIGVALLAGAGIAAFHVGVEQHWWAGLESCGSATLSGGSAAELREQLLATPVVRCDEVVWSLFGISMAGYNLIASLALGMFGLWAAGRLTKEPRP